MSRDDATSLQITLVADNQNGRLSRAYDSVERYTHAINIESKNNSKYKDGSNLITFHRHHRKTDVMDVRGSLWNQNDNDKMTTNFFFL